MSFPFEARHGLIVVRAELFGPSGSIILGLALDTGATSTMVNVGPLVAVSYDPSLTPDRVQVTTGSGVEFVPRITASRLSALGQEYADFQILGRSWVILCPRARASTDSWDWISFEVEH